MKAPLAYIVILLSLCCCKQQSTPRETNILDSRETLTINFNTNLLSLDSSKLNSPAEKFVYDLVFHKPKYTISSTNDDILYSLTSIDSLAIKNINIRFLKNEEAILGEFVEGNLDLFMTDFSSRNSPKMHVFVQNVRKNPYSKYNLTPSNVGSVAYYEFYNFESRMSLRNSLKIVDSLAYIRHFDSTHEERDTTLIEFSISYFFDETKVSNHDTLKNEYHQVVQVENIDDVLSKPHIIYRKQIVPFLSNDFEQLTNRLQAQQNPISDTLLIKQINPEYYITKTRIKGLKDYSKLSDQMMHIYFDTIQRY
ncbi:hypothetical protein BGP76_05705 [Reichenbachiella sp. MSK19-1]|nr:hypothetical protein BGP76_05705 [Reichenbachiella sp. MSK19-1]